VGAWFVTQHGRDQLHANWPDFYNPTRSHTAGGRGLAFESKGGLRLPECYYDAFVQKLVLAPEYGGDGKTIGYARTRLSGRGIFPPIGRRMPMVRYDQKQFRRATVTALHRPSTGRGIARPSPRWLNVVFQPLTGPRIRQCEIFADGFAGAVKSPAKPNIVPLAWRSPDGSPTFSDDIRGRSTDWSIKPVRRRCANVTPCPKRNSSGRQSR